VPNPSMKLKFMAIALLIPALLLPTGASANSTSTDQIARRMDSATNLRPAKPSTQRITHLTSRLLSRGYSMVKVHRILHRRLGLVQLTHVKRNPHVDVASRRSANTDVDVFATDVFYGSTPYSTRVTGWYIQGSVRWHKDCNVNDTPFDSLPNPFYCWFNDYNETSSYDQAIGGDDGLAVRYDSKITQIGSADPPQGWTTDAVGGTWSEPPQTKWGLADNSSYGAGFTGRDRMVTDWSFGHFVNADYSSHLLVVTIPIKPPPCNVSINYYTRYFHTWSDSAVTGFGINATGFNVSWTNTPNSWSAAAPVSTYKRSC